jgi:hypothetical protein
MDTVQQISGEIYSELLICIKDGIQGNLSKDKEKNMKRTIIITVFFLLCYACNLSGEEISKENITKIQRELDSILISIQGPSGITNEELTDKIINIKRLLLAKEYKGRITKTYTDSEMVDLINRVKKSWPYRDQKILLQRISSNSRFYMKQIKSIIEVLDFPDDRKDAAKILLPRVLDPENIDVLYGIFWTLPDKEYVNSLLPR